jgi:hypothetical protein
VEPLLRWYGVQAYLAGHDHDLEHIHAPGQRTHHIVSGAGSQVRPEFAGARDSRFQAGAQGEGPAFGLGNLLDSLAGRTQPAMPSISRHDIELAACACLIFGHEVSCSVM